jgi:hypothetical protein
MALGWMNRSADISVRARRDVSPGGQACRRSEKAVGGRECPCSKKLMPVLGRVRRGTPGGTPGELAGEDACATHLIANGRGVHIVGASELLWCCAKRAHGPQCGSVNSRAFHSEAHRVFGPRWLATLRLSDL